ncbi:MAG: dihydroorotase [Pseudomonadota bacterium]
MTQTFDLLLKGGTVVNQDGIGVRDIGVRDGGIAAIGVLNGDAGEIIDCTGLTVLPGVMDTQVHFREPGLEHKETLETGSLAAVMGGVTTVFEMPNTSPLTVSEETLADKLKRAERMHCDHAFFMGGTAENADDLPELERLPGVPGVKVFMGSSTGSLLVEDDDTLDYILARIRRRASFHSEDEPRLIERKSFQVDDDPSSHPVWRDVETAMKSTRRLVTTARRHGKRIHVLHISTWQEMAYLADHKDVASVEVTPHHLTFDGDVDYPRLGTYIQMNPPVRNAEHRDRIWSWVQAGVADILGSDHAPHTRDEKERGYPNTPSGMPGVQTLVPVMLNHVAKGRMTLERFVDMTSAGPARLFGMVRKGRIAAGYDADFTIVDLNRRETITDNWIASICGWTPYAGMEVTGWPIGTILRGQKIMWERDLVTGHGGKPVRFLETMQPQS